MLDFDKELREFYRLLDDVREDEIQLSSSRPRHTKEPDEIESEAHLQAVLADHAPGAGRWFSRLAASTAAAGTAASTLLGNVVGLLRDIGTRMPVSRNAIVLGSGTLAAVAIMVVSYNSGYVRYHSETLNRTGILGIRTGTGAAHARLSVASDPPGARVYLDEELVGVTPFSRVSWPAGRYKLVVDRPDHRAIDSTIIIDSDHSLNFFLRGEVLADNEKEDVGRHQYFALEEVEDTEGSRDSAAQEIEEPTDLTPRTVVRRLTGAIHLTSTPPGATVYLAGEYAGETPLTLLDQPLRRVEIELWKDDHVPYSVDVFPVPGTETPFHAALAPMTGTLIISVQPGADLIVDGRLVSEDMETGHTEFLPVGNRSIEIRHPRYGTWTTEARISEGEASRIQMDLEEHAFTSAVAAGESYFETSRYAEAIDAYEKAIAIRPHAAELTNKIALAKKAMSAKEPSHAWDDQVHVVVDRSPELIGGLESLHADIEYPTDAYAAGVQGRVYLQFVVDERGIATDIVVAKGLPAGCNEAAIEAVRRARFQPAQISGRAVKARSALFVNFMLE